MKETPTGLTPLLRDLMFEVLPHFGLEHLGEDELLAADRHKNISDARAIVMFVARAKTTLSYPELGRCFGRDSSTIMTAVRKVETHLDREPGSRVSLAARAVMASFHPDKFEAACHTSSGARELNFGAVPLAKIELDLDRDAIGAVT